MAAWLAHLTDDPSWWSAYCVGQVHPVGFIEAAARRAGRDTIIVLDNLPDLVPAPEVSGRLATIAAACQRQGARLITTSQRALTREAKQTLAPSNLAEIGVPPMETADALAMLEAAGAPSHVSTPGFAQLLTAGTKGHPALLSAAMRWMEARKWVLDWNGLSDILTGAAAADEREAALRRMVALVPNDDQRDLLCRLSLVGRPFGRGVTEVVANVEPVLPRPGELLNELVGPWIDRIDTDKYEVSPLLSDAGPKHLTIAQQKTIHEALAQNILRAREIPFIEGLQAVVHLFAAQEWIALSTVLVRLMMSVRSAQHAKCVSMVVHFFPAGNWPDGIPLSFRVMIRSLQVKTAYMAGEDAAALDGDLDKLIAAAHGPDESLAAFWALLQAGPLLKEAPPGVASRRALEAARMAGSHAEVLSGIGNLPLAWEELLWAPVSRVRNLADVGDVLDVMYTMKADELRVAFGSELAPQALQIMANSCWLRMAERPEENQDWTAVLSTLDKLDAFAKLHALQLLQTMTACARAITLADYLKHPQDALKTLADAGEPQDPTGLFLLRYTAACILDDNGKTEECISRYHKALAAGGDEFVYLRFCAYVRTSEACARLGEWDKAIDWARAGLRYALAHRSSNSAAEYAEPQDEAEPKISATSGRESPADPDRIPDVPVPMWDKLELCGELGIALWHAGMRKRALGAFCALVQGLSSAWRPTDERFREVFRKTGHNLGWFATVCASGKPPAATTDGAPYEAPSPGMFVRRNPRLADLSMPIWPALLWYYAGRMASALNLRRAALRHLSRAAELAGHDGLLLLRSEAQCDRAVLAAARGFFGDALTAALEAIRSFPLLDTLRKRGENPLTATVDPTEAWEALPEDDRRARQMQLFWLVIAPALVSALVTGHEPNVVGEWSAELVAHDAELVDRAYWEIVLEAARKVLNPVRREELVEQVNAVPYDDTALRLTLYLARCEATGSLPVEAVQAHSVVLSGLMDWEEHGSVTLRDFCCYVVGYWRKVTETRAFRLRSPGPFKLRMASIGPDFDQPITCQILLWAEEAAGVSLLPAIRAKLSAKAQSPTAKP